MTKILSVFLTILVLAFIFGSCREVPVGSLEYAQNVAEEFVKMEATFRFDGMLETLKLASTTSIAKGWKFVWAFNCRHAGYGNRTGQNLAQVITPHVAVVTVLSGKVESAIMDEISNMIK